jgi:2-polyprenyl-6-methoxyphenol hydroxylase-like FAD-dependent oxidoreductase
VKPPPQAGGSEESLNADRSVVRSVLIKGLEEFVEFGKEFLKYELTPTGITVHFTDGSKAEGILLVGADGTKSRIRKQLLPNHIFMDTEGRWFYGKTTITPELLSELSEHVANGFTLVQDRTKEVPFSLLCEPVKFQDNEFRKDLPFDYIYWVICSRKDNFEMDDAQLFKLSSEEAVRETLKLTAHWDPSFRALFTHQDKGQTSILRIDSAMADLPVWETQSSVTLIGDSVHAMSPTSVVGAVSALRSAATLSKVLAEEGISAQSLRKYEDEMRQYTGEAIRKSVWGGKMLFGMRGFDELKPAAV